MNASQLEKTVKNLRKNHFEVFLADTPNEARTIFLRNIFPILRPATVSWGDSETLRATGCIETLRTNPDISIPSTFGPEMSPTQKIYRRRQALLSDLFLSGINALTEKGQLVNLDMVGNRIAGITFGPKNVVLFLGINKIVSDLEAALQRIRTLSAPQNIMRHEGLNTPCRKTGCCMDCDSPHRICNTWTITENRIRQAESRSS